MTGFCPPQKNADSHTRIGASCAQGSFKVIGPPTSGARACSKCERWHVYTKQLLSTQSAPPGCSTPHALGRNGRSGDLGEGSTGGLVDLVGAVDWWIRRSKKQCILFEIFCHRHAAPPRLDSPGVSSEASPGAKFVLRSARLANSGFFDDNSLVPNHYYPAKYRTTATRSASDQISLLRTS